MKVSLEDYIYSDCLSDTGIAFEALASQDAERFVYVVLSDTQTAFSKVSKMITGDPYNHVSIMLDYDFDNMYTFSIRNGLNRSGGFMREDRVEMRGARYSLYKLAVDERAYLKLQDRVKDYFNNVSQTSYNHFGLINAVLKKGVFKDEDNMMICSQFVATLLSEAGIELFKGRALSTIRPYEFVKSKLLKFVERGTIR